MYDKATSKYSEMARSPRLLLVAVLISGKSCTDKIYEMSLFYNLYLILPVNNTIAGAVLKNNIKVVRVTSQNVKCIFNNAN